MRLNIPPATRVLLLFKCSLSLVYFLARFYAVDWSTPHDATTTPDVVDTSVSYLTLVPSKAIYHPWTILTSVFVEQNIVTLAVNLANILFGGRYLERAWGSKDFAVVVLVAATIPNLLVIPTYAIWGAITLNHLRDDTPIAGAITLQAAFLVAFKQLVPEHTVSVYKGVIKVRVKHFPAIFLLLNTIGGIIFGTDTALLLGWYGLVTTWIYLRFFKYQPDITGTSTAGARIKGDASETFAFATFFPNVAQPPIAAVCDQIYLFFCKLNIIRPFSEDAIASGNQQAAARGEGGLPSLANAARGARPMSKREEAERRRALALRALDQRLAASQQPSQVPTAIADAAADENDQHGENQ